MMYEISTKTDLVSGMTLSVRFPEEHLDEKALYTLQYDMPGFLVPFHSRAVDGEIELTYCVGNRSKLRYFNGAKSPDEYVRMWEGLLQPLLDCGDWFLKAYSFVMDSDYLFYDKQTNTISYLYIPAKMDCSSYEELKVMLSGLAAANTVTDSQLENVVLRMLVEDFRPKDFLDTLRDKVSQGRAVVTPQPPVVKQEPEPTPLGEKKQEKEPVMKGVPSPNRNGEITPPSGDIVIHLSGTKAPSEDRRGKNAGEKKDKKQKFGLFSGKKGKEQLAREEISAPVDQGERQPVQPPVPVYEPPLEVRPAMEGSDVTQLEEYGTGLRLVGMTGLPGRIEVDIQVGGAFSVGRYDKDLKRKQSSFEFPTGTVAVSRRHAVIERDVDGYTITDLSSRAGTFVNGVPLSPNVPYRLHRGEKISFGTSGADYIWEE